MVNNEIEFALNERFLLQKEYWGENKLINQIQPVVSVTVATYQHVNYIRKCLDGILMQKTTFPYEIILGEDGSIDGTQDICKEYAEKFPGELFNFLDSDTSKTRYSNWTDIISYSGFYETDDYKKPKLIRKKMQAEMIKNSSTKLQNRIVKFTLDCFPDVN